MAGVTLPDYAQLAAQRGEYQKQGVINTFRSENDLLSVLPFPTIPGNSVSYTQETDMATAGSRNVNATWTSSQGLASTKTEPMKIYGGTADYDLALVETLGPQGRAWTDQRKAAAIARQISFDLLEGSSGSTNSNMDGLKTRIGTGSTQASDIGSAGAMSMRKLDLLRLLVDSPTHWVTTKEQALNVWDFLRSGTNNIRMSTDEFGNEQVIYGNLPMLIVNRNGDQQALPFTESSSTASLFCVSIGPLGYTGFQFGNGIKVQDLGLFGSTVYRTLIEWYIAQGLLHPRCVARGYNFTNAKAIA